MSAVLLFSARSRAGLAGLVLVVLLDDHVRLPGLDDPPAGDRSVRADEHDFDAEPQRLRRIHLLLDLLQALEKIPAHNAASRMTVDALGRRMSLFIAVHSPTAALGDRFQLGQPFLEVADLGGALGLLQNTAG